MSKGFSLLELLIAMAIFSLICSFGFLVSIDFYRSYVFNTELETFISLLKKARSQSQNNIGQSPHGIAISGTEYILFSRPEFGVKSAQDLVYPKDMQMNITEQSNTLEIVFTQLSGSSHATVFNFSDGKRSRFVRINQAGQIEW